jgi:hypothetical protein
MMLRLDATYELRAWGFVRRDSARAECETLQRRLCTHKARSRVGNSFPWIGSRPREREMVGPFLAGPRLRERANLNELSRGLP